MSNITLTDVRRRAMDLLARREHGIRELARKLLDKGFEADLVSEAIEQLREDNLVSDQRYCEAVVKSRCQRGQGPLKITWELRSQGVPDAVVDATLRELAPDWQQQVRQVIEKKYAGRVSGVPAERAKQVRFLCSRGFPQGLVMQVLRDVEQDT
jgi:regulatory protein